MPHTQIKAFPGQKPDEIIELVIRKHWFPHLKILVQFVLGWLLPVAGYIVIIFVKSPGFFGVDSNRLITLFFLLYLMFIALILFIKWLNEELDAIIITNKRIISMEQIGIFQREFSETSFEHVQDIKSRMKGIANAVFQFGCLEIQTAAEKILFEITDVPKPEMLCEQISDIIKKHIRAEKNPKSADL